MKDDYKPPFIGFHLDVRLDQLIAVGEAAGALDQELSRSEVARWLGVSDEWVAIREREGVLRPNRTIRGVRGYICKYYKRGSVIRWLRTRQRRAETQRRLARLREAEKQEALAQSTGR